MALNHAIKQMDSLENDRDLEIMAPLQLTNNELIKSKSFMHMHSHYTTTDDGGK